MATLGRILLVDDEPLVLEMFEDVFTQKGYDVVVASTAKEAVNHVNRLFFDVLVCDVKLDGLDGFDLLSIARRKSKNIEVILITGAPSDEDAKRASASKAIYLSKPVGLSLMLETVEQIMQRSTARVEAIRNRHTAVTIPAPKTQATGRARQIS